MDRSSNYTTVWQDCLACLRSLLNEEEYTTWFTPLVPVDFDGRTIKVRAPSVFVFEHIEANYVKQLGQALQQVIGADGRLVYDALVDSTSGSPSAASIHSPSRSRASTQLPITMPGSPQPVAVQSGFNSNLNPRFSFEHFFESGCNKIAVTVGQTIASVPGTPSSNPFFLYGPSGVGKTHLCQAIGLKVKELHPEMRVLYVSSHLFELQYTTASRSSQYNNFINFYQQIDVLIIDDIQGLIGKTGTQKAFFEIFNHLYMLGKQLILTSDKPPVELKGMHDRLITRISGALVVPIDRPDIELRHMILHHRMEQEGVHLKEEVINYLADNLRGNVRELEGTLISLITNSVIQGKEIDLNFVECIVKRSVEVENAEITMELILEKVSVQCAVSIEKIRSKSRLQDIVQARHLCMYLAKKYTPLSLNAIGQMLGGKNHTTVLHGHNTICDRMCTESDLKHLVENLERSIGVHS